MFQPVIRLMPLLFAALVLFPACSPEPQEVHAITEFDVGYRPSANIQQQVEVLLATARWEGSVYPIERRGRTDVEVRIDENAYMYSLEDGGLEASATKGKP